VLNNKPLFAIVPLKLDVPQPSWCSSVWLRVCPCNR